MSFAADNHIAVGSGYAHGGGRVTIMSYVPSGVMMKVGSIKDGRLGGESPVSPLRALAVCESGREFAVTERRRRVRFGGQRHGRDARAPLARVGLQAQGRAAATAPLSSEDEDVDAATGWTPNGHRSLAGATALAMGGNRMAYVASADAGSVVALDAYGSRRPVPRARRRLRHETTPRVADLCAQGGRAAAGDRCHRESFLVAEEGAGGPPAAYRRQFPKVVTVPRGTPSCPARTGCSCSATRVGPRSCPTTSCHLARALLQRPRTPRRHVAARFSRLTTRVLHLTYESKFHSRLSLVIALLPPQKLSAALYVSRCNLQRMVNGSCLISGSGLTTGSGLISGGAG